MKKTKKEIIDLLLEYENNDIIYKAFIDYDNEYSLIDKLFEYNNGRIIYNNSLLDLWLIYDTIDNEFIVLNELNDFIKENHIKIVKIHEIFSHESNKDIFEDITLRDALLTFNDNIVMEGLLNGTIELSEEFDKQEIENITDTEKSEIAMTMFKYNNSLYYTIENEFPSAVIKYCEKY